jgi:hypothetical protein
VRVAFGGDGGGEMGGGGWGGGDGGEERGAYIRYPHIRIAQHHQPVDGPDISTA